MEIRRHKLVTTYKKSEYINQVLLKTVPDFKLRGKEGITYLFVPELTRDEVVHCVLVLVNSLELMLSFKEEEDNNAHDIEMDNVKSRDGRKQRKICYSCGRIQPKRTRS